MLLVAESREKEGTGREGRGREGWTHLVISRSRSVQRSMFGQP